MDAISTETVRLWSKELDRLKSEQAERVRRISDLERKISAAAVLGLVPAPGDPLTELHPGEPAGDAEAGLPSEILGLLSQVGHGLKPPEIKRRLIASGIEERRFGANGSYFYTVLGRLVKRGAVSKRGKNYSIPK